MKIITSFFMLIIVINTLLSENWEPFPLDQVNLYQISLSKKNSYTEKWMHSSYFSVLFDSISGNQYFSRPYRITSQNPTFNSCQDSILFYQYSSSYVPIKYSVDQNQIVFQSYRTQFMNGQFGELKIVCDTVEFVIRKYPEINKEELFSTRITETGIDSVKIKLIERKDTTIFSVEDSIMRFQIVKSELKKVKDSVIVLKFKYDIVLSKYFGLISYFPFVDELDRIYYSTANFDNIVHYTYKLIGVKKEKINIGEVHEIKNTDKINLLNDVGDFKIYEYQYNFPYSPPRYIRDSVISLESSADRSIVGIDREEYVQVGQDKGILRNKYQFANIRFSSDTLYDYYSFNKTINLLNNNMCFIPSMEIYPRIILAPDVDNIRDTLISISIPILFKIIKENNLNRVQVMVETIGYRLLIKDTIVAYTDGRIVSIHDQEFGDIFEYNQALGSERILFGGKLSRGVFGNPIWPPQFVSVFSTYSSKKNIPFPNPALSTTHILLHQEGEISITAIDVLGRSFPLWSAFAPAGDMELDVCSLPTGTYTLLINNGSKMEAVRLIKN